MNEKLSAKESLWIFVTIVFGILLYARSLFQGFVWDDGFYVFENPLVRSWSGLLNIWFHNNIEEYYPITFSCLGLEYKLWGLSAFGFHVISLLLHLLNGLLLFGLVRKWAPSLAGIAALFFVIHPIQVETVAWITEQKNLLCFFFFFLAVHAYLDFEKRNTSGAYLRMLLFFIAALLSKSIAVCFAFVPLLYVWWQRGTLHKRDFLLALPLFLLGMAASVFHLYLMNTYVVSPQIPAPPLHLIEKMTIAGRVFFFYIRQILLPREFMTFYPKWTTGNTVVAWVYPVSAVILYLLFFWKRHRLGRGAFALLCFYGISLFPVSGFLEFSFQRFSYVADHFAYLSFPAILLLGCSGISLLLPKIRIASWVPSSFFKKSILTAVILYLSIFSFRLTLNYKNHFTLWWQLLRQNPSSSFAYGHLGVLCMGNPKSCTPEQTVYLFQKAILLKPDYLDAYVNLAKTYERSGRYPEALQAYRRAIPFARPFTQALCYLEMADIHLWQGQLPEARSDYEKSISFEKEREYQRERRTQPEAPLREASARRGLADLCIRRGDIQKAIALFQQALALDPNNAESYMGLGAALMNAGDYEKAAQAFRGAQKLDPENESVKNALVTCASSLNRT